MLEHGPFNPWPAVVAKGRASGGFMVDAHRAHPGCPAAEQHGRLPAKDEW
jgi:hypothetical protein